MLPHPGVANFQLSPPLTMCQTDWLKSFCRGCDAKKCFKRKCLTAFYSCFCHTVSFWDNFILDQCASPDAVITRFDCYVKLTSEPLFLRGG